MGCYILLLALLSSVAGLYREEAGRWDWMKESFGSVVHVTSPPHGNKGSRLLVVGSKEGIVGAIAVKGGNTVWRRMLPASEEVRVLHATPAGIVAAGDRTVFVFALDGVLLWEGVVPSGATPFAMTPENDLLAAKDDGTLMTLAMQMEYPNYGWASPKETPGVSGARYFAAGSTVLAVHPDGTVAAKGAKWETIAKLPKGPVTIHGASAGGLVLCAEGECKAFVEKGGTVSASSTSSTSAVVPGVGLAVLEQGAVVSVSLGETRHTIPNLDDKALYAHGSVVEMWVRESQSGTFRWLLLMEDGTLVLLVSKDGEMREAWTRDDHVGEVVDAITMDIPFHTEAAEQVEDDTIQYYELLKQQLDSLQEFVTSLPRLAINFASELSGKDLTGGGVVRREVVRGALQHDKFGMRRVVVLASSCCVYGLHTDTGKILWRVHVGGMAKRADIPSKGPVQVRRILKSEGLGTHPLVFVWAMLGDRTVVFQISHMTGKLLGSAHYPGAMMAGAVVDRLHYTSEHSHVFSPLVMVDHNLAVHTYPNDPAVAASIDSHPHTIYMHYTDKEAGVLTGYLVGSKKAKKAWSVSLHRSPGERIVSSSYDTFDPFQFVYTDSIHAEPNSTRHKIRLQRGGPEVKGLTSMDTRYVNPNVILVATAVPPTPVPEGKDPADRRSGGGYLVLYLVDCITGAVLNSMLQPNAVAPVHIVAAENMFVYHFYNTKRARYQLGVWQLFEDTDRHKGLSAESTTNLRYIWQAFTRQDSALSFSSFEVAPPIVYPSAFTFPCAITAI
eukprot:Sspe_Gene.32308::Locus_15843_Transcript_1_1_Confidence_1.000_Length_3063::g.32308::m.32308